MKSSSLLYLIRSCPTVLDEKLSVITNQLDPRLSEEGVQRAKFLADAITGLEFGAIFSSAKLRAMQTTRIVAQGSDTTVRLSSVLSATPGVEVGTSPEYLGFRQKINDWLYATTAKYSCHRILAITNEEVIRTAVAIVSNMPDEFVSSLDFDRGSGAVIRAYRGKLQLEAMLSHEEYTLKQLDPVDELVS